MRSTANWIKRLWLGVLDRVRSSAVFLTGYDVFVSYAWADGQGYPTALAKGLSELRYKVCLDKEVYQAGEDLNKVTERRVRRSRVLLVVLRPEALRSRWVAEEIRVCITAKRIPVLVDVNGTFQKAPADHVIRSLENTLRISETVPNQDSVPGPETIDRIARRFTFMRAETRFAWSVSVVLALLLFFGAAGAYFFYSTRIEQRLKLAARLESSGTRAAQFADNGSPEQGVATALEGLASFVQEADRHSRLPDSLMVGLSKALDATTRIAEVTNAVHQSDIWPDGRSFLLVNRSGTMAIYRDDFRTNNSVNASFSVFPVRLQGACLFQDDRNDILAWGADTLLRVFSSPDYTVPQVYGQSNPLNEVVDAVRHVGTSWAGVFPQGGQFWGRSQDGVFRVFDQHTALPIWSYGPNPKVVSSYVSPNGQFLALVLKGQGLQFFKPDTKTSFAPFQEVTPWPTNVARFAFFPDSSKTMLACSDGKCEVRSVKGNMLLIATEPFQAPPRPFEFAFASEGASLVLSAWSPLGGTDCRVVDSTTFHELGTFHVPYQVMSLSMLSHDAAVFLVGNDFQVHLVSLDGLQLRVYGTKFSSLTDLKLSRTGERLLATDFEHGAELHELFGSGPILASTNTASRCLSAWFDSDGRHVLALFANSELQELDAQTLRQSRTLAQPEAQTNGPPGFLQALSSWRTNEVLTFDGKTLAWLSTDLGTVRARLNFPSGPRGPMAMGLCGNSGGIYLFPSQQESVQILDRNLHLIGSVPALTNEVTVLSFYLKAADSLVVGSLGGTVRVCDPNTGAERKRFKAFDRALSGGFFSRASARVLFAGDYGHWKVLDLNTGTTLAAVTQSPHPWAAAVLSSNASTALLFHNLGFMELRNTTDGSVISQISLPKRDVDMAQFSPDDKFVFITDGDGAVREFSAKTGNLHRLYNGHAGRHIGFAISPDSKRLLTWAEDNRMVLWSADDGDLVRKASRVLVSAPGLATKATKSLPDAQLVAKDLADQHGRLQPALSSAE